MRGAEAGGEGFNTDRVDSTFRGVHDLGSVDLIGDVDRDDGAVAVSAQAVRGVHIVEVRVADEAGVGSDLEDVSEHSQTLQILDVQQFV